MNTRKQDAAVEAQPIACDIAMSAPHWLCELTGGLHAAIGFCLLYLLGLHHLQSASPRFCQAIR